MYTSKCTFNKCYVYLHRTRGCSCSTVVHTQALKVYRETSQTFEVDLQLISLSSFLADFVCAFVGDSQAQFGCVKEIVESHVEAPFRTSRHLSLGKGSPLWGLPMHKIRCVMLLDPVPRMFLWWRRFTRFLFFIFQDERDICDLATVAVPASGLVS